MRRNRNDVVAELLDEAAAMSLAELADASGVHVEIIIEMVDHDIVTPQVATDTEWRFAGADLLRVRRAVRLRRDLDLNWSGVGLVGELLDELGELKRRHRALLRRLG